MSFRIDSSTIKGVKSISMNLSTNEIPTVTAEFIVGNKFQPYSLSEMDWENLIPGDVILKCKHCGQWGAKKCECKKCGAPIE